MKHRNRFINGISVGILLTILIAYMAKSLLLLAIGLFWAINAIYSLKKQQMAFRRQLEELSCQLNSILDRKVMQLPEAMEDTLEDKLTSQIGKLQDLLQYYDQRLWNEQESIKKLITEIAHQLRTPLANIESYLSLCRQETDSGRLAVYLEAIQKSEEKIAFLIENFIKISRLEHYCIQIRKERLDLRETILQAMVNIAKKADAGRIELKLLTKEPVIVLHDKNWLREAVENLLDNSIKYSSEGSTVEVSFQYNQMFARIRVRDYGIGIEEGEESSVFARFYRGKRVTTQEGFGIGLYLAREIVLCHDGFLKISRKEPGLLAEIYLPQ